MWIFIVGLLVAIGPALSGARAQPAAVSAEPPLPYASAVAARFPAPPAVYRTPGLLPERRRWTDNAELAAALRTLAGAGAAILLDLGRTDGRRPNCWPCTSAAAPGGRWPCCWASSMATSRPAARPCSPWRMQLADPGHPLAAVLDRMDVLLWPRINPDGAALDRRGNAAGLDINRDHLLLQTREARGAGAAGARARSRCWWSTCTNTLRWAAPCRPSAPSSATTCCCSTRRRANLPAGAGTALAEQDFRQPLLRALAPPG